MPSAKISVLRHQLRGRRTGTIEAMVVACADEHAGTSVYTGDPNDLAPLAAERMRTRIVGIA